MNKTIFGLCLMAGLSLSFGSCSSDSDDDNIDVNVKPSGNWYTTSGFSGVQLMTYNINSKDSNVCVITVEDSTKNDTVYTMIGGVSSFKTPVTTVTFPSSTDGPQKATLTYKGNQLAVQITGGKTKINDFTVLKTPSQLNSVGGFWSASGCTAYFKRRAAQTTARISITADSKTVTYSGTYVYDKATSKGTFTSTDKKTTMTFSVSIDSKTNISTLSLVNGTTTYQLKR